MYLFIRAALNGRKASSREECYAAIVLGKVPYACDELLRSTLDATCKTIHFFKACSD